MDTRVWGYSMFETDVYQRVMQRAQLDLGHGGFGLSRLSGVEGGRGLFKVYLYDQSAKRISGQGPTYWVDDDFQVHTEARMLRVSAFVTVNDEKVVLRSRKALGAYYGQRYHTAEADRILSRLVHAPPLDHWDGEMVHYELIPA